MVALEPFGAFLFLTGGGRFWIALIIGGVIGAVVNLVRPRYESTVGRRKAFYDFFLKQLSPPD